MKYCQYCGGEIHDEAVICIHCGRAVPNAPQTNNKSSNTLVVIAMVFMIIKCAALPTFGLFYGMIMLIAAAATEVTYMLLVGILFLLIFCVPLAWMLPLTITVGKRNKTREPIGVAIKVCTLLFVSPIAGILLLCHNDD